MAEGSEVWLANDEVLGKDVTLHILPAAVTRDSRALQELRADIKRNRQLIHPQILRVYDLIEEPEWTAISMNAFAGESVASRRDTQPDKRFAAAEIEPWVLKLAQIIEDAHKIHFLHRDVAPENIFLTPSGEPLVANFGISRTIQDALVRAGQAASARLAYASPQTLEGQAPVRSDDVYSLGAVLYTILVGAPPFTGGDVAGAVRAGVTPEILSALEREELHIPPPWQKAIGASLRKSPEDRPQSAAEFLKILKGEASAPAPSGPVAETTAEVVPLPLETPAAEPVSVAKVEAPPPPSAGADEKPSGPAAPKEPVSELEKDAVIETAGSAASAERLEAVLGPESEVEIIESLALERLAKREKTPPESPAPPAPSTRPEPKKPGGDPGGGGVSPPSRPFERTPLTDFKTRLYPEESRFLIVAIGVAAVILIGLIIYFVSSGGKKTNTQAAGQTAPEAATPTPVPEEAKIHNLTTTPVPPVVVVNTPPPKPAPSAAELLAQENLQKAVAEKQADVDAAKQAADDAEKARTDRVKEQQSAAAAVAESQKSVEEKAKANDALKVALDEIAAQRKKLEDSQKAAQAAAEEAQRVAAEKARVAEEGKKAIEDLEKERGDKMAMQDKGIGELESLQKAVSEKQRLAADAVKAAADAETARQQQLAVVTRSEQDLASARTALEMHNSLAGKIGDLKKFETAVANPSATPAPSPAAPTPLKSPVPTPVILARLNTPAPATPVPATPAPTTPVPVIHVPVTPPPTTPVPVIHAPVTPAPATPAPATPVPVIHATVTPVPATPLPATPAPATPVPATPAPVLPATAGGGSGANSLGMKFAPVGDVDFCIWLVRVKDFGAFAHAVSLKSSSWESPGFKQEPDHPVVNVTWVEALVFCKWLTDKEHKEGTLPENQFYRLPSDLEWSKAVGLPVESGKTPEARDMDVPDVYPWGTEWPPPKGAGNYTGEETGSDVAIRGYDDGYAWTSPVGSFNPNKYGLYDMGGNVWEWCMDNWNNESKAKVLRGASWYNGALKLSLLSSCRVHAAPDSSTDNYGFRIVRATEAPAAVKNKFR